MSFVGKAIGSITGSNKQAKAATQAAQTQADATDRASQIQKEMYDQTRKDLSPYTQAGTNALSQLTGFNPQSFQGSGFNYNGSSNPAYSSQQFAAADPYQASEFKFEESPSYQFRKQQGMDGIQSQAATGGGLLSGATLKALNNYNSNLASQEYDNAFNQYQTDENRRFNQYNTTESQRYNQYLGQEQLNQGQHQQAFNNWQSQDNNAYNRYMTDQNNQYNRLYNLVGIGQNSAAQVGNAGMQTGQAVANNTMAGANATAAGQVAAGNKTANNFNSLLGAAGTIGGLFI